MCVCVFSKSVNPINSECLGEADVKCFTIYKFLTFSSPPTEAAIDPPKTPDSEPFFTKLRNPSTGKFWNCGMSLLKFWLIFSTTKRLMFLKAEVMMIGTSLECQRYCWLCQMVNAVQTFRISFIILIG